MQHKHWKYRYEPCLLVGERRLLAEANGAPQARGCLVLAKRGQGRSEGEQRLQHRLRVGVKMDLTHRQLQHLAPPQQELGFIVRPESRGNLNVII